MASNGAKQPLLSGLLDSTVQSNSAQAPSKRRFRRVKSAPAAEFILSDVCSDRTLQHPESIFRKIEPSIRNVAILLAGYLGVGTMCFYIFRDDIEGTKTNPILDAMYFSVVTMTTVGYGDLVPNTAFVKMLACVFVFTGVAIVGLILSKAADYLVEKQEIMLVEALNKHKKMGQLETMKDIETNRVRYKCYLAMGILSLLMMVGTIFLLNIEKMDMIDAVYCVCSTVTTLGFGDESFSTRTGRAFGIVWILISTLGLGQVFLYVAEVFTETRQRALVNWVLTRKTTNEDLEAADIDNNGVVGAAEFILYKLKEMGKITEDDISIVMEEFEKLDVDESGTLSVSDLVLAQSKR
ncbi:two-pore potassium channel 1 [Ricinus communis]|uniref:Calcium-activated outward-rectifying potassium channel, putative n=1 Tax=Ricinus communis TaxID=3988 RepID=B9S9U1_RICCO|nr:two-pore potassium channel 1 [Ricinus communis]XP_015576999.1 two-pore potassium channel 1 [Ricinus communis]XP_048235610.1 two-pore potassium channel 1 [Ricinus communis]EEF39611.1 Calcium-activated outward-rectifying potassium channel, putative [Ricinus communis]|eukprot:XP_002522760.1 two-pore potassium channel 1 [Ricinus communis]